MDVGHEEGLLIRSRGDVSQPLDLRPQQDVQTGGGLAHSVLVLGLDRVDAGVGVAAWW